MTSFSPKSRVDHTGMREKNIPTMYVDTTTFVTLHQWPEAEPSLSWWHINFLIPQVWQKPKTHKRLQKKTLFIWTKKDKTCNNFRKSSFSSYVQHKNRKTISSTYLVSVGCGRLAEGKGHENDLGQNS